MAKKDTIVIDGAAGEGGGQILRSALGLSLVTGKSCCIEKIRAGRAKPGLLRQHLTALTAAAKIGGAKVEGATIGSKAVSFHPGEVTPGEYSFAVGTAGSATLVLQTILPALLTASKPSRLVLEGGTHNPAAPPFDFLQRAFLLIINQMGPVVTAEIERYGFYPAGGGRFVVEIQPAAALKPISVMDRGEIKRRAVTILSGRLPRNIAEKELHLVKERLNWPEEAFEILEIENSAGPGNVVMIQCEAEALTEIFTGFGEKGVPAGSVTDQAVDGALAWLASGAPVGRYLADQLLLPFALARGGAFKTMPLSRHSLTNIDVIRQFLNVEITTEEVVNRNCVVRVQ